MKKSTKRVLLVDDDSDTLSVLEYLFQSAGLEVVSVNDSTKVVDRLVANAIEGKNFDLIAIDIRMPNINGNQLAKMIREKGFSGLLIALTAAASGNGRKDSKDSGFDHYFGKKELKKEVIQALVDINRS